MVAEEFAGLNYLMKCNLTTEAQRHREEDKNGLSLYLCATLGIFLLLTSQSLGAMRVVPLFHSASTYECLQWRVELDRKYGNPFDPDEIAVDATFTGPGGKTMVMPGFWEGGVEAKGQAGAGVDRGKGGFAQRSGVFMVRFAAPVAGKWSMTVRSRDVDGVRESRPSDFEVNQSKSNGFIHPAKNRRYFQYDSGKSYFILGLDLAWGGKDGIKSYEQWFPALAGAGGNFARVWTSYPPMESLATGLGRYDQATCALMDQILELAQKNGIACMITLGNYRDLIQRDEWGSAVWPESVYNAANKGPATQPADFFTSAVCQKLYRQRLRYVAGRWGAYTSVFAWEFWNEQTFTGIAISPAWTRQMAQYLDSVDPYHHPISTSFGANDDLDVWKLPEISLTQEHIYPGPDIPDGSPVFAAATYFDRQFDKPTLVAESGIGGQGSDVNHDTSKLGTNFHNGLWSAMMAGSAGGACIWWWDNYVAPLNLWHVFTGASRFAHEVDWAHRDFEPIQVIVTKAASGAGAESFSDIEVSAGQGWGRSHGKMVDVQPNGQTMLLPPQYIYGPEQKTLRTPTLLSIDMPKAGEMIVRVVKVSDYGVLRVYVDGKPEKDFAFSALPASVLKGGKTHEIPGGIYQATIQKDCAVALPAGRHTIELSDLAGDWLAIQSIKFTNARSSKYAEVYTYALTDPHAGRVIAWLHDPQSNWRNDADGKAPKAITGANILIPKISDGKYTVQWWDTYKGEVSEQSVANSKNGRLDLAVPEFKRDIALRIFPAD